MSSQATGNVQYGSFTSLEPHPGHDCLASDFGCVAATPRRVETGQDRTFPFVIALRADRSISIGSCSFDEAKMGCRRRDFRQFHASHVEKGSIFCLGTLTPARR